MKKATELYNEHHERLWRCARAIANNLWSRLDQATIEDIVERDPDEDCTLWHDLARHLNTSLVCNFCDDGTLLYKAPENEDDPDGGRARELEGNDAG